MYLNFYRYYDKPYIFNMYYIMIIILYEAFPCAKRKSSTGLILY